MDQLKIEFVQVGRYLIGLLYELPENPVSWRSSKGISIEVRRLTEFDFDPAIIDLPTEVEDGWAAESLYHFDTAEEAAEVKQNLEEAISEYNEFLRRSPQKEEPLKIVHVQIFPETREANGLATKGENLSKFWFSWANGTLKYEKDICSPEESEVLKGKLTALCDQAHQLL